MAYSNGFDQIHMVSLSCWHRDILLTHTHYRHATRDNIVQTIQCLYLLYLCLGCSARRHPSRASYDNVRAPQSSCKEMGLSVLGAFDIELRRVVDSLCRALENTVRGWDDASSVREPSASFGRRR